MRDSFPLIKGIIPRGWKEYTAIVSFNGRSRPCGTKGREKFFAETKLVEGGGDLGRDERESEEKERNR